LLQATTRLRGIAPGEKSIHYRGDVFTVDLALTRTSHNLRLHWPLRSHRWRWHRSRRSS
jgi:hypothetical protein